MTLKISDEQQAIIDSKEDTIVISNPGAGKTTTLSLKVIDLL
jgi:superfamily I DNA/RNA helicase